MNQQLGDKIPYAGELNVSPWDSLLTEVRRSAYRASWVDERVTSEREREDALERQRADWEADDFQKLRLKQSAELRAWLDQSRLERAHGAQVARAAVSAGLSEKYISSIQAEARQIAQVLSTALDAANLSEEQRTAAHAALRTALADVGRSLQDRHDAAGGLPVRPEIEE